MAGSGRYLYAVTRGLDPDLLEGVAALGGGRLEVVEHRGLMAVVSSVDLDEFGEEALRQNLESLEWLELTARIHDDVVKTVSAAAATAPVRLATICLGDDGVRRRLDEWYVALGQVLDRVEGRREWSVKSFAPAASERPARPEPAPVGSGGGAAYLRAKKEAAERRLDDESAALRTAEEVHDVLSGLSVASRRLPPQDPRLTGHTGTMVLNGAYLVEETDSGAFEAAVERLTEAHPEARLACAGPWPPYSFAMLDQR